MKMCENCPFRKEAEVYCDGNEMKKICIYSDICQRVLETTIHETCVWEDMTGNREFSF